MIEFRTVTREFRSLVSRRRELFTFLGSVFAALGIFLQNALQGGLPPSLGAIGRHVFAFYALMLMVPSLLLALRSALAYRRHSGASLAQLLGSALKLGGADGLSAAQTLMAANAPMVIQKAMVDGLPAEGVLPAGQVAAAIDSLPGCAELIEQIVRDAEQRLGALCRRIS